MIIKTENYYLEGYLAVFRKDMYVVGFESNVWKFLLENDNKNRKLLPRRIYYTSNNVFIYIILYSCLKQYINSYGKQTILIHVEPSKTNTS